jgi:hypothetical protein
MQQMTAAAGTSIFAAGDVSEAFYIFRDGEVSLAINGGTDQTENAHLSARQLFGDTGTLEAHVRVATTIAIAQTALFFTPADTFVHDDDIALASFWHQELAHPGEETGTIDRLVEDAWRDGAIAAQTGHEGLCFPMHVRHFGNQPLAAGAASM